MLTAFLGALTVATSAVIVLTATSAARTTLDPAMAHWSSTLPVPGSCACRTKGLVNRGRERRLDDW